MGEWTASRTPKGCGYSHACRFMGPMLVRLVMNPYEPRRYLNEYLLLHYGQPKDRCAFPVVSEDTFRFHERIIRECLLPTRFPHPTRALDVGCAAGRLTLELTRVADQVIGIDNSTTLIRAA